MWSYGYTDPFVESGPEDVYLGDCRTFRDAVSELFDNVTKMACDAEKYEESHYEQVLKAISDIKDDPGIMDDPDQWEDQEFTDEIGEIVYYVVES